MALSDYPNLTGEVANLIAMDVAEDIPPKKSRRLEYGREELAFYKSVTADFEKQRRKNPKAVLDIRD